MKAAKKALALLLSALMLFGFGAGVSAETQEDEAREIEAEEQVLVEQVVEALPEAADAPRDDDEAEAWALLTQTMEDLRGDYTMHGTIMSTSGGYHYTTIHSNGTFVFDRWSRREMCKNYKNPGFIIYPEKNVYVRTRSDAILNRALTLEPKQIAPEKDFTFQKNGEYMTIQYDGVEYRYYEGNLSRISRDTRYFNIYEFEKGTADKAMFSLRGMFRLPTTYPNVAEASSLYWPIQIPLYLPPTILLLPFTLLLSFLDWF